MDINELIKKSKMKNRNSFGQLVTYYGNNIYGYIHNITGDVQQSNRLFVDVWKKVYTNLKYHQNSESFVVWLFNITKHTVETYLTHHNQTVQPNLQKLEGYLAYLSESEQQLILMKYFEGLSTEELANGLSLSMTEINNFITNTEKRFMEPEIKARSLNHQEQHYVYKDTHVRDLLSELFKIEDYDQKLVTRIVSKLKFRKIKFASVAMAILVTVLAISNPIINSFTKTLPVVKEVNQYFEDIEATQQKSNSHTVHIKNKVINKNNITFKFKVLNGQNEVPKALEVDVTVPGLTTDIITMENQDDEGWFNFEYTFPPKAYTLDEFNVLVSVLDDNQLVRRKNIKVDMREFQSFEYKRYPIDKTLDLKNAKILIDNLRIRPETMEIKYKVLEQYDTVENRISVVLRDNIGNTYYTSGSSWGSNSPWITLSFNNGKFDSRASNIEFEVTSVSYYDVHELDKSDRTTVTFEDGEESYTLKRNDDLSGNLSLTLSTENARDPFDFPRIVVKSEDLWSVSYNGPHVTEYVNLKQEDVLEAFGTLENLTEIEDVTPFIDLMLEKYDKVISEDEIRNNLITLEDHDVAIMKTKYDVVTEVNLMIYDNVEFSDLEFGYISDYHNDELDDTFKLILE